jgi:hypothetical protein
MDEPIENLLEGWRTPNTYGPEFGALPQSSGLYLLVRTSWANQTTTRQVLYVGMSHNIAQRLRKHEIKQMCDAQDGEHDYVQVWFRSYPRPGLRKRERTLIQELNPSFNLQHRRRGV